MNFAVLRRFFAALMKMSSCEHTTHIQYINKFPMYERNLAVDNADGIERCACMMTCTECIRQYAGMTVPHTNTACCIFRLVGRLNKCNWSEFLHIICVYTFYFICYSFQANKIRINNVAFSEYIGGIGHWKCNSRDYLWWNRNLSTVSSKFILGHIHTMECIIFIGYFTLH